MFYFELYADKRLQGLKQSRKINIVNDAVKLYRNDFPLNLSKRLLSIFIVCCIPSLIAFFLLGGGFAVGWFSLSITILDMKNSNDESPQIRPYLDQVLECTNKTKS
jgi:hypothetical protein